MRTTKLSKECKTSKLPPEFRVNLTKHSSDPKKIWDEGEEKVASVTGKRP